MFVWWLVSASLFCCVCVVVCYLLVHVFVCLVLRVCCLLLLFLFFSELHFCVVGVSVFLAFCSLFVGVCGGYSVYV